MKKIIQPYPTIYFIIGVPRSGTYLLGDLLKKTIPHSCFISEINDFWKRYFPFVRTDYISYHQVNDKKAKKIRDDFYYLAKKSGCESNGVIIEKTAANCFRLDAIRKIFPEAKFIHILRDGRDVALSIKKKYNGNIQKISNSKEININYKYRFKTIYKEIRHKLKHGFSIILAIRNFNRYISFIMMGLKLKNKTLWGPRYPGYKYLSKKLSQIELAGEMWKTALINIDSFLFHLPKEQSFEIRYEELTSNTKEVLHRILNFMEMDTKEINTSNEKIIAPKSKWKSELNKNEIDALNSKIGYILNLKGYNP